MKIVLVASAALALCVACEKKQAADAGQGVVMDAGPGGTVTFESLDGQSLDGQSLEGVLGGDADYASLDSGNGGGQLAMNQNYGNQGSANQGSANQGPANQGFANQGNQRGRGGAVDLSRLPAGAIVLTRATINDPGVIRPGPALSALVPAGWQTQGGVAQQKNPCGEPYVVNWSAVSPDGASSVAVFPTDSWQWSNTGVQSPCRSAHITNARDYLSTMVRQTFPDARIIDFRQRDDFARSAIEEARRISAMFQQSGLQGMSARAEGGEVLFAFRQNGRDMRGVAGVSAIFYESALPNPMGGPPMGGGNAATLGTFAATAPNGQLNFDLIEASRRSIAPDPNWIEALFALKAKLSGQAAQATREMSALIVAGGAEATQRNIAAYRQMAQSSIQNSRDSVEISRRGIEAGRTPDIRASEIYPGSNAQDRMQRETIEGVRGVETYYDPIDNRPVQLDMNYDHAWRVNGSDSYILTKDPNFNPGQYGVEAVQMGVVR